MESSVESTFGDNWVRCVSANDEVRQYSWNEIYKRALVIAGRLSRNSSPDEMLVVDCPNCVALVSFILAAAFSNRLIVLLNPRLSDAEKLLRVNVLCANSEEYKLYGKCDIEALFSSPELRGEAHEIVEPLYDIGSLKAFASKCLLENTNLATVMFTSGTTGKPKAAVATWRQLACAAMSANARLNSPECNVVWQLALPMCHIAGLQIILRALLCGASLIVHEKFQAVQVLSAAKRFSATHISVVDKMLQDLLAHDNSNDMKAYSVVLLGGAAINPKTVQVCLGRSLSLYASYGMTETCSMIAVEKISQDYTGGAQLLDGYNATIAADNALCISGPGVFEGYITAASKQPEYEKVMVCSRAYFKTTDVAEIKDRRLFIKERLNDMFVSGGENVYPSEIRLAILSCVHVQEACVIGVPDLKWGHRPVAFVQADKGASSENLSKELSLKVSKLNMPIKFFMMHDMPRNAAGKIDSMALRRAYECRLQISDIKIHEISQELKSPFKTANGEITSRESLIIEIIGRSDSLQRDVTGLGECVAFSTNWYMEETLPRDKEIIAMHLVPLLTGRDFLTPWEFNEALLSCDKAVTFPMARAAVENAGWDMYAKNLGLPLWKVLRSQVGEDLRGSSPDATTTPAGLVIGLTSTREMLEIAAQALHQGYTRIKLKVTPSNAVARVKALRNAYPELIIMLDANQSFSMSHKDITLLKELDQYSIYCIEEPIAQTHEANKQAIYDKNLHFEKLAELQQHLKMKVCLDESIVTEEDLRLALQHEKLSCYAVKIGKLGGLCNAIKLYQTAKDKNIDLWMAGMYETSVSKRMHAAFQKLDNIIIPGDLSSSNRYFPFDIATPEFSVQNGEVSLNPCGFDTGLGCEISTSCATVVKSH